VGLVNRLTINSPFGSRLLNSVGLDSSAKVSELQDYEQNRRTVPITTRSRAWPQDFDEFGRWRAHLLRAQGTPEEPEGNFGRSLRWMKREMLLIGQLPTLPERSAASLCTESDAAIPGRCGFAEALILWVRSDLSRGMGTFWRSSGASQPCVCLVERNAGTGLTLFSLFDLAWVQSLSPELATGFAR